MIITKKQFIELIKILNPEFTLYPESLTDLTDSEILSKVYDGDIFYKNRYDIMEIHFSDGYSFCKVKQYDLNNTIIKDGIVYVELNSKPRELEISLDIFKKILQLIMQDDNTKVYDVYTDEYLTDILDIESNFLGIYDDLEIIHNLGYSFEVKEYNFLAENCEISL